MCVWPLTLILSSLYAHAELAREIGLCRPVLSLTPRRYNGYYNSDLPLRSLTLRPTSQGSTPLPVTNYNTHRDSLREVSGKAYIDPCMTYERYDVVRSTT